MASVWHRDTVEGDSWTHWPQDHFTSEIALFYAWLTLLVQGFVIRALNKSPNFSARGWAPPVPLLQRAQRRGFIFWLSQADVAISAFSEVSGKNIVLPWSFWHFCSPGCKCFCIPDIEINCERLQPLGKISQSIIRITLVFLVFQWFQVFFFCGLVANPVSGSSPHVAVPNDLSITEMNCFQDESQERQEEHDLGIRFPLHPGISVILAKFSETKFTVTNKPRSWTYILCFLECVHFAIGCRHHCWVSWQFPFHLSSNPFCSARYIEAPESTTNSRSSGICEVGAGIIIFASGE